MVITQEPDAAIAMRATPAHEASAHPIARSENAGPTIDLAPGAYDCEYCCNTSRRAVRNGLTWIFRILLYLLAVCKLFLLAFIFVALSAGLVAATGAVWTLIGNAMLRKARPLIAAAYVETNGVAAAVGSTGSIPAVAFVYILMNVVPTTTVDREGHPQHARIVRGAAIVLSGSLAGATGMAILGKRGPGVLYGIQCGASGAAITIPVLLFAPQAFALLLVFVLSPLLVMMSTGLEFMFSRRHESLREDGSYSMCSVACIATFVGREPNIQNALRR